MLSYRLGTVKDFHWGFNPVFRYIANLTLTQHLLENKIKKIHTLFLHILWRRKRNKCAFILSNQA